MPLYLRGFRFWMVVFALFLGFCISIAVALYGSYAGQSAPAPATGQSSASAQTQTVLLWPGVQAPDPSKPVDPDAPPKFYQGTNFILRSETLCDWIFIDARGASFNLNPALLVPFEQRATVNVPAPLRGKLFPENVSGKIPMRGTEYIYSEFSAGWPFRALYFSSTGTKPDNNSLEIANMIRQNSKTLPWKIPMGVRPGLLFNTLIFSGVVLSMMLLASMIRIRRRLSQNSCTSCGYDKRVLAPGTPCPECGST